MRNAGSYLFAALLLLGCSRGGPSTETLTPISSGGKDPRVWGASTPVARSLDPVRPVALTAAVQTEPLSAKTLSDVRNITVQVQLQGAPASQNVEVEFEAPGATAYERQVGAVPDSTDTAQMVAFKLPVAGTFIDTNAMTGTWRAHVFIDGQERTVASFELTP